MRGWEKIDERAWVVSEGMPPAPPISAATCGMCTVYGRCGKLISRAVWAVEEEEGKKKEFKKDTLIYKLALLMFESIIKTQMLKLIFKKADGLSFCVLQKCTQRNLYLLTVSKTSKHFKNYKQIDTSSFDKL